MPAVLHDPAFAGDLDGYYAAAEHVTECINQAYRIMQAHQMHERDDRAIEIAKIISHTYFEMKARDVS